MATIDYDRTALILVEAAYFGDTTAAQKWSITERTIRNYRARLNDDAELSALFRLKKAEFERDWAGEISAAIRSSINFLQRASQKADPTDPDAIHAVAGSLKIMAEITLTKEILDARLGRHDRPDGAQDNALAAGIETE